MKTEASERAELPQQSGEIRCPDDIVREIADRRFEAAFGSDVPQAVKAEIRENHDKIEKAEDFEKSANQAGISTPENVLGFVERADEPAHIRDGPVPVEIATKIHEDIHRATHPETMKEMTASPEIQRLYEGITEYLTQKAAEDMHGNASDFAYESEVRDAESLSTEVGEPKLQAYLFRHESTSEIEQALDRIRAQDSSEHQELEQ